MRIIGEAHQQWAPLRRKYNLFLQRDAPPEPDAPQLTSGGPPRPTPGALSLTTTDDPQPISPTSHPGAFSQFAYVDAPFLSWDFPLLSASSQPIGSVTRNFAGFGREIFTDTGVYALRMDAAGPAADEEPRALGSKTDAEGGGREAAAVGMTLDQRAVMLATAVSVDFDYFSRKSGVGPGGWMPLWFPGGGGAAAEGGAAGGAGSNRGAGGKLDGTAAGAAFSVHPGACPHGRGT